MLRELVSAIRQPLPPGTPIPEEAQERAPIPTEANNSPATEAGGQPIHGDADSASTAPSSDSVAPVNPGATLHVPPALDFLSHDAFHFAPPPGPHRLGLPTQGFAALSAQRDPLDQVPPLSSYPHAFGFLPRQDFVPTLPQPRNDPTYSQFDIAGGQTFGLQPLGYSESMSFHPSASASSTSQVQTTDYLQSHPILSDPTTMETGENLGIDIPDFALMDDALMGQWSNLPPAMG